MNVGRLTLIRISPDQRSPATNQNYFLLVIGFKLHKTSIFSPS